MKFSEMVEQASDLLQRQVRISYRALKREFDLDDETLDLRFELIRAKRLAKDEYEKFWSGTYHQEHLLGSKNG